MNIRFTAATVLCIFGVSALGSAATYNAKVTRTAKQTMKGWGCYPAYNDPSWANPYEGDETACDYIFKELGADIFRMEFWPECGNKDGSLNTNFINSSVGRALTEMHDRGRTEWYGIVWSPPQGMKRCYTNKGMCPDGKVNTLLPEYEDEFCKYITSLIKYLNGKGFALPIAYSIQNELAYAADWGGCVYTKEQWIRVTKMMRQSFDSNGLSAVKLIGPESSGFNKPNSGVTYYLGGTDLQVFKSDAELEKAVWGVCGHAYSNSDGADATAMRTLVQNARSMYGKDSWQTEMCQDGDTEMGVAMANIRGLLRDVVYVGFNYWFQWLMYHDSKSGPNIPLFKDDRRKVYYSLQSVYTRVRPGAVVLDMESDDPVLRESHTDQVEMGAFAGPDRMVVVFANPSSERTIKLTGLTGTTAKSYLLDASHDNTLSETKAIADGTASFTIPANSQVVIETNAGIGATSTDFSFVSPSEAGRSLKIARSGAAASWCTLSGATVAGTGSCRGLVIARNPNGALKMQLRLRD